MWVDLRYGEADAQRRVCAAMVAAVRVKQARVVGGDGGRGRLVVHFADWRRAMMGHGDCAGIGVPVRPVR
jgi:hypothetical protein